MTQGSLKYILIFMYSQTYQTTWLWQAWKGPDQLEIFPLDWMLSDVGWFWQEAVLLSIRSALTPDTQTVSGVTTYPTDLAPAHRLPLLCTSKGAQPFHEGLTLMALGLMHCHWLLTVSPHWEPALMALWSNALPLTAHSLSPMRACPDGPLV